MPNQQAIPRAAAYIRVSSEEQAMHGLSLGAQKETLLKYAAEHKMKLVGVYADEGITARKKYKNRLAFMRMLEDVKAGKIDVILFIKLDRWFRNIADYYEVQKILDAHNVQWIATEERYDTTTANGRLNLNIRLSIAQDESDRTSERIKFVFADKVRRGEVISGKVPFGYRIENKRLVPDPEAAEITRDIFSQYLNIRSVRALRKYVMDKYGMVYSPTGMRIFLQNRRYIGEAHDQEDFCEPIIDPELFSHVQEVIAQRAQRVLSHSPRQVYLFSGLLYCAECGNRLSSRSVRGKYTYYRCTRHEKLHLCTHKRQTSELSLEKRLVENLVTCFEEYNASIQNSEAKTSPIKSDIAKIKKKLEKLKDLYLNDLIEREDYERDYHALRQQLSEAEQAVETPCTPVDIERIKTLMSGYFKLSMENKKGFWSRTVSKIIIDNNDNFQVFPFLPNPGEFCLPISK